MTRIKREPRVRYDSIRGLAFKTENGGISIVWSPDMISLMKREYPFTLNDEMAGMLGVSKRTVIKKAKELGLVKDRDWLMSIWKERCFMAHCEAKRMGYPGCFKKGNMIGAEYRFKTIES